jgi:hypothetical protein
VQLAQLTKGIGTDRRREKLEVQLAATNLEDLERGAGSGNERIREVLERGCAVQSHVDVEDRFAAAWSVLERRQNGLH